MDKKMDRELVMKPKHKALKSRTGKHSEEHKMKKTHHSREYCRHCGKETSRNVRHESGHREFDCVDAPGDNGGMVIKG